MPLSPMMQHYVAMKEEYPDSILFYRLGDFYEMFFEDAKLASRELELTLTGRDCGLEERAPMCGVPFHAADTYIGRLVEKGYKVAICEQVEDPKTAKGMVKREVIRIVTPGTILSGEELEEGKNHYIMSLVAMADRFGMALADITTGQCLVSEAEGSDKVREEILKFRPAEIVCNQALLLSGLDTETLKNSFRIAFSPIDDRAFDDENAERLLRDHFRVLDLKGLGLADHPLGKAAAGGLFRYLYDTQKSTMSQMTRITTYRPDNFMLLDTATRRNLELVETLREKDKRGSLLWVLDKTKTAMGARLLRGFVEQPLIRKEEIEERLDAVEELVTASVQREELREYLQPIYDLERLASRITSKTANPRDLIAFRDSLAMLPFIRQILQEFSAGLLKKLHAEMDPLEDLCELIRASVDDDPPLSMKEGGIIRDGYSADVDNYRLAGTEGKNWLADLEAKERERTGIRTLRIKFNRVFGYYIEVTNSFKDQVPEEYTRRQTLANAERYTTDELKKIEESVLGAQERLSGLEYELFCQIRDSVAAEVARIQKTAQILATLDALASLAFVASRERYVRPKINTQGRIRISDGRHPVVEKMLANDSFIPNDTDLDKNGKRVAVITGPNMAGKSTYMRQTALICLLAQIGSFVPAAAADIGVVDRIFTRVGASDDLASGQSTFMVEMSEVANILRSATADSLLILDEIGRGTSTFDGLSIAWAVIEHIADKKRIGAKTLFATHYHELTELEGKMDGVLNYCIAVKEKGEDIVFLRKIIRGGADRSYGIQVARLAGVPEAVLSRARQLADQLSDADITASVKTLSRGDKAESAPRYDALDLDQISLSDAVSDEAIIRELSEMDLSLMTPLEALNNLHHLQSQIKNRW